MNYENASVLSNQNIVLKDRKKLEISGIKKIESLNSEEFLIDTKLGLLFIKGQDLEMQMLDIDKDKLIQFALQVDNYTYMTLPLVMYILMKYYDSYFVKEEL